MPLEFALRPRISLERPPARRRFGLRVPKLVLPIAAYWLGIAGVTHVLLRATAAESSEGAHAALDSYAPAYEEEELEPALAPPEPPPPAAPAGPALAAPLPSYEPAPEPPPAPEAPRGAERAAERSPEEPLRAQRAPVSRPEPPRAVAPPPVPRAPERTALLEPLEAPEPPPAKTSRPVVPPEPPPRDDARTASLPSCESAAAAANETMDLRGPRGAPDLTRDAFASVLENGAYLSRCSLPASTALEICAAVQDGKVVGVTVTTEPRNAAASACVRRAVAGLRFPKSARLDVTRTRFEAAR